MTDYEITHDDENLVWIVSYDGRPLRATGTRQEAKDYVVECRAFDALLDLEAKREIDVIDLRDKHLPTVFK